MVRIRVDSRVIGSSSYLSGDSLGEEVSQAASFLESFFLLTIGGILLGSDVLVIKRGSSGLT